jgi:hypothetical protein
MEANEQANNKKIAFQDGHYFLFPPKKRWSALFIEILHPNCLLHRNVTLCRNDQSISTSSAYSKQIRRNKPTNKQTDNKARPQEPSALSGLSIRARMSSTRQAVIIDLI